MSQDVEVTLNKFKLRWYQEAPFDAIENNESKRVLYIAPRRAGKDILGWNLAIRQCIRKTCLVFYVLPTFQQARRCIFDAITIDSEKFIDFIPKELIASVNQSEMKIRFKNDSILQCIGGDTYDSSLVGTNPYAVILSEYALMPAEIFSYIRPILAANGGWCLVVSCVAPDTLVLTRDGFKRIETISFSREEYSDLNEPIYGLGGFHNAEQYYYGGKQQTLKITLQSGYELECTPVHPLWNGSKWVKAADWKIGDLMPVQYGQEVWGPGLDCSDFHYEPKVFFKKLRRDLSSLDFFYLLGILHSDGNYSKRTVTISKKKDPEIIEFIKSYGFITRPDGIHHDLSSTMLASLLEFLGFKHGAKNKLFPEDLLSCTKDEMKSFLQGIFDCDGCSASAKNKRGYVTLTSTCQSFIKTLQIVLLNFGIASSFRTEEKAPSGKTNVWSTIYNLEITGYFAHLFYRDIGFRLARKQRNWRNLPSSCQEESGNIYPVDISRLADYSIPKNITKNPRFMTRRLIRKLHTHNPHPYLAELLQEKLFYSPVKQIEKSENEVFDFVIPETHSFITNGIISHNTPRGKNHLWHLWKLAQELPDWKVFIQKTSEIGHIPDEILMQEKQQMDEGLFLQEYECSFERGIEGSYYGRCLDRLKNNNQICDVAWEPGLQVHTAWDIGVRDATCIIFFQSVDSGSYIRIIDFYSNNNVGLDHYARVLQDKPYRYGKHFAPHDISVREWGGGAVTRYEKAHQLGIEFECLEQIGVMDGIENVWTHFNKFWIDKTRCKRLIDALENYRREWDDKKQVYSHKPLHNWASNAADALRYMCQALHKTKRGMTSEEFERAKAEALYGSRSNLPRFFSDDSRYNRF